MSDLIYHCKSGEVLNLLNIQVVMPVKTVHAKGEFTSGFHIYFKGDESVIAIEINAVYGNLTTQEFEDKIKEVESALKIERDRLTDNWHNALDQRYG